MEPNMPENSENMDLPVSNVAKTADGQQLYASTKDKNVNVIINMPKPKRKILVSALLVCIFIIVYLFGVIGALASKSVGSLSSTVLVDGSDTEQIAVWTVAGSINTETADEFDSFVRQISKDETIKAVVVRVDSPGGAVSPSDRINRAIAQLRTDGKNVVVSMGSVAASGGYFLSAASDWIVAEPSTITGSIGVISMFPVIKGAADMMGIDFVVIRSTRSEKFKAAMNYFESPTSEALAKHKQMLDDIHDLFVEVVSRGRTNLGTEGVEPLADGRVWVGQDAMDVGLVDEIGYMDTAIAKAKTLCAAPDAIVKSYSKRSGFASNLFGAKAAGPVTIDSKLIDDLTSTRVMLLWKP